tara:strand:+ start:103 stop:345 length:243 start_codon:yes stop_codon:yes gene_type:complete
MYAWIEYFKIDRPLIGTDQVYLNSGRYEICVSLADCYLFAIDHEFHLTLYNETPLFIRDAVQWNYWVRSHLHKTHGSTVT